MLYLGCYLVYSILLVILAEKLNNKIKKNPAVIYPLLFFVGGGRQIGRNFESFILLMSYKWFKYKISIYENISARIVESGT